VLHAWTIPADVRGTWEWTAAWADGRHALAVALDQRYQEVRAALRVDGQDGPPVEATLVGDRLRLRTTVSQDPPAVVEFRGTVDGDSITGDAAIETTGEASRQPWHARRVR
jgi:hypothetical protein